MTTTSVTVQSDALPRSELDRLMKRAEAELPPSDHPSDGIHIEATPAGADRTLDPVIVSTLITAGTALLAPFLAKLAELLFRAEPDAQMMVAGSSGDTQLIVDSLPAEQRDEVLRQAIEAGAITVTIAVATPGR